MTLETLLTDYRQSLADVHREQAEREAIMQSEEYRECQEQIEALQALQEDMLSSVSDTSEEHAMDKEALIQWMQENKRYAVPGLKAKTRRVREVDTYKALQALDGDIDALMVISSIKIGALDQYAKDNPEYRKYLMPCVIEKDMLITDLIPDNE